MSKEYDNTNTGALFKNLKKKNDKAPAYTGKIDVEGKEYRIAAWLKKTKDGDTFMSLKIEEPQKKDNQHQPEPEPEIEEDYGDDIPF